MKRTMKKYRIELVIRDALCVWGDDPTSVQNVLEKKPLTTLLGPQAEWEVAVIEDEDVPAESVSDGVVYEGKWFGSDEQPMTSSTGLPFDPTDEEGFGISLE